MRRSRRTIFTRGADGAVAAVTAAAAAVGVGDGDGVGDPDALNILSVTCRYFYLNIFGNGCRTSKIHFKNAIDSRRRTRRSRDYTSRSIYT